VSLVALVFVGAACTVFNGLTYTPATDAGGAGDGGGAQEAGTYASAVLADAPLAYWRFEDGTSTTARDATGHGNDCEYVGAGKRGVPSASAGLGSAVDLDGKPGSYLLCGDAPFDFAGAQAFSLEAWIRPRVADDIYRKVLSKDKTTGPRDGYNLSVTQPGVVRVERYVNGVRSCSDVVAVVLDAWVHVVTSFDGKVLRLDVNGTSARADCTPDALPDTPVSLTLGAQSDASYGFFDGVIDELAVYDHVLSGERIAAHRDAAR
jgi:hypothetical protein